MWKYRLLLMMFLAFFTAIMIKLFILQVVSSAENYNDVYLKDHRLEPERGRIFDRHGQPLAINQTAYLVFVEPKKIDDQSTVISKLDEVLQLGEATIAGRINKEKEWVLIKDKVNSNEKEMIERAQLEGVGFQPVFQRFYPEASLSAHLLGFVGKDYFGNDQGYFGIEGYYNQDLVGLPGVLKSDRDLIGRPIFVGIQERIDPENGRDLYLTIDKAVQVIVKKRLKAAMETYQASEGCVIVAEPYSLEIIALSCLPDFDLDNYFRFNEDYFRNPAISDLYEPGSTFKPLVMAAAIEEKAVRPMDSYDEKGPITIGDYTIRTWNNQYEGTISMTRILEKSSNVGMVFVGDRLGSRRLYRYLKTFGFGEITDIDLQGEVSGLVKDYKQWYPIDFATVTFGQGIAVTPIQMIRAFSALINGGWIMRPMTVKKIRAGSKEKVINSKIVRQVISPSTSKIIKKMLVAAVDRGEVKWLKPSGYEIGGKTGTAQVPIRGHYDPTKTIASFIGFAPVENPRFIALVLLKEPKTSPWGSETAAPVFFEIAKELIVYYNIAPEQ